MLFDFLRRLTAGPAPPPTDAAVYQRKPKARSRHTILVVDDDWPTRQLAARALEADGHQVLQASSAAEAVATAHDHPGTIHLVVTDLVMPRMDGFVLSARLTKTWPAMKVLWTSGYGDTSPSVGQSLRESSHPFLPKPYRPETLRLKVRNVLNQPLHEPA